MHKPIRIIKDDARVRLTQQVNLVSALRTALLTLPESFEEEMLFEKMASFSYRGDPRMKYWGENPKKVKNIVSAQRDQFKELYWRLAYGLQDVHWSQSSRLIHVSPILRMPWIVLMSWGFFFLSFFWVNM